MLKNKTKEIIVCIIALMVLAFSIGTNVFAATNLNDWDNENSNDNEFSQIPDENTNGNNNNSNGNANRNNNNNNNYNNNYNNNINNSNGNSNNKNASGMPNTGVDYSIVMVIVVCGASTLYAYKKIRDYKNIQ